jgi:hypothetical protein
MLMGKVSTVGKLKYPDSPRITGFHNLFANLKVMMVKNGDNGMSRYFMVNFHSGEPGHVFCWLCKLWLQINPVPGIHMRKPGD